MRNVVVVSRIGLLERKRKLLISPFRFPALGGTLACGMKARTFNATGLSAPVILLSEKAVRHGTPPTDVVVEGSKIWPLRIGVPSHGLLTPVEAPSNAEKSPVRSRSV